MMFHGKLPNSAGQMPERIFALSSNIALVCSLMRKPAVVASRWEDHTLFVEKTEEIIGKKT
jgi:hypothetical protein